MTGKTWFVVEAFELLVGIADDIKRAEVALRIQYREDFPDRNVADLMFREGWREGVKDWYFYSKSTRKFLWNYRVRETREL